MPDEVHGLQRAESEFDPLPFDAEAARAFGRVSAAVLPLYTVNPDDFTGLSRLLTVAKVAVPA